jgi:hypothetical protein
MLTNAVVAQSVHDPTTDPTPRASRDSILRMPAPSASVMSQLAKLKYGSAKSRGPQSINADKFLDEISEAICSAWATWQVSATLVGVLITGPTAAGGQIVGPPLTPLILAKGPRAKPEELRVTTEIANAIGTAWLSFTATVKVLGMPWYPAFAAFPGPVAPPTPNIPCPFAALGMTAISVSASTLKSQMAAGRPETDALYDAISDAFEKSFEIWKVSTMVTRVLGTGPIPTFAPPYVPIGPVVGGFGTMLPGGFT